MMSYSDFKKVVDDYLSAVEVAISLFRQEIGETAPLKAWHDGRLPQTGRLSDEIEYQFHGIGCLLVFSDYEVDFDFGQEGRTDGFDLWRLTGYLSSCKDKYPGYSQEQLKHDFIAAVSSGEINKLQDSSSNLYYLI